MQIIVDTSVIIAVLVNESTKEKIIEITKGTELIAPGALHYEIGNALSALMKKGKIEYESVKKILKYYYEIPIKFINPDLVKSLEIANGLNIYAYDAYFLECARSLNLPIFTLDRGMINSAKKLNINFIEV
ncbi:MAG: twitching motility protein PilT [Ignavibacterium sp.]|nr:MAG: twitching motility protein PilT [Ignavibacterium sp.]